MLTNRRPNPSSAGNQIEEISCKAVKTEGIESSWLHSAMVIAWMWSAGLFEACCLHRMAFFFIRSRPISQRTLSCFLLNGTFLASIYFLEGGLFPSSPMQFACDSSSQICASDLSANLPDVSDAGIEHVIGNLKRRHAIFRTMYSVLWLYPAYIVIFVINCLWYKDIARHAFHLFWDKKIDREPLQGKAAGGHFGTSVFSSSNYLNGLQASFLSTMRVLKGELSFLWPSSSLFSYSHESPLERNLKATPGEESGSEMINRISTTHSTQDSHANSAQSAPVNSVKSNGNNSSSFKKLTKSDSKAPLDPILQGVGEQVFSLVMLSSFSGQVFLVSLIPYVGQLSSLVLLSWLYAYYCFDYRWGHGGWSLEKRLHYFESHWPFFSGFGIPCVLSTFFLPTLVSATIGAFLFPLFVLVATACDPHRILAEEKLSANVGRIPIFRMASAQANFLIRVCMPGVFPSRNEESSWL